MQVGGIGPELCPFSPRFIASFERIMQQPIILSSFFSFGRKICHFPQFTANFIIFHETILVFFSPFFNQMVFRSDKVPKVSIAPFFHFHIMVLNLPVCFKLLYWKLPSRCLTLKLSFVYFQFHLRDD